MQSFFYRNNSWPPTKIFDDIIKKIAYMIKKIEDFKAKGQEKRIKNIEI
ncbi:hypothetical protein [Clostridium beijerinckii]|nr:hypothetical protein [Clostridium beijerinckii]